ncbi:MAG: putative metallopeptidase [Archangium sp.]|nr:putative metallopeptidase [Archangium sp.]
MVKVRRRPDFTQAVRALIAHVAAAHPHFAHLDARRILVVAGEARRASRGTVKPLTFAQKKRTDSMGRKKPRVKIHGRQMLYSITLRPLFFRHSTPRQRVATVLHELFHISKHFDGTLDHQRRHEEAGEGFEAEFAPIERACWKRLPPELVAPFAYDGEVRVLQWLEKPQSWLPGERASQRSLYTEKHLFEGVVRMKTVPVVKTVH